MIALMLALVLVFPPSVSSGIATWYADPRAAQGSLYAAVPGYHGRPYYVTVRLYGKSTPRVRVLVQDSCQCYVGTVRERAIDLSWRAFAKLAPLGRGIVRVVIER